MNDYFTVRITRKEFLKLPMEARQRILKEQAEDSNPVRTFRDVIDRVEKLEKHIHYSASQDGTGLPVYPVCPTCHEADCQCGGKAPGKEGEDGE